MMNSGRSLLGQRGPAARALGGELLEVVGEVEGVRAGNAIAFGVEGRHGAQNVIVVAETRESTHLDDLVRRIVGAVTESVGIPPKEVVLVDPGTVPKTSSGKLQRSACRQQYQGGELARR